jgi:basic amino acid/polyamine antiporter, APA family
MGYVKLPESLTLVDATTIVVGSMIGSGIFLKASAMSKLLPHPGWLLLAWFLGGLLTLCGSLTLAEMAARFPKTGGLYVYIKEGYGPLAGYLFGWSLLAVMETGSIAAMAAGAAQTLDETLKWDSASARLWIGHSMIWSLTIVHCLSVRLGIGVLQNLFTGAKGLGILFVIFFGFTSHTGTLGHLDGVGALPPLVSSTGGLISIMGLLVMKTLWAYDGWINATFVAGELKDSSRQLPKALIGGSLLVILLYLSTNCAYHFALSSPDLAANKSAAVAVARVSAGELAAWAIGLLTAFSMFGTLNGSIMSAPRVYFAMAADGLFIRQMSKIHPRFQTPYVSLLVQAAWSSVLLSQWGTFEDISDNVMFIYWIFYALGAAAIFRFSTKDATYVTPLRPLTAGSFIIAATFLIVNSIYQKPESCLQGLALVGIGLILYPLIKTEPMVEEAAPEVEA